MSRILTDARKAQIMTARETEPDALGPLLGELVIAGNLPVETLAQMLAVAPPTIYRWMYGEAHPRDADKIAKVKRLIAVLRRIEAAGEFPLPGGSHQARAEALVAVFVKHRPSKAA